MTLPAEVSRQYLKAMGVESWELRGVTTDRDVVTPSEIVPGVPVTDAQMARVAESGIDFFLQNLATAPVEMIEGTTGQVLLLLEAPSLTAEGQTLLTSMLKAIDVDLAAQCVAYLGVGRKGETVASVAARIKPSIIIVMAQFQRGIEELASHRSCIHSADSIAAPVAVSLHPGLLLKSPELKRPAWEDLKRVKASLDA